MKQNSTERKIFKNTCPSCKKVLFSDHEITSCANCNKDLSSTSIELVNPIFSPKPFSLLITKSSGVLSPQSYNRNDILHVGISNSSNEVYNFWFKYKIDKAEDVSMWQNVLNIELSSLPEIIKENFDEILKEDMRSQSEAYSLYHQFDNNCYDYICRFLNGINYSGIKWDKHSFALNVIEPHLIYCEKYFDLFKQIYTGKENSRTITEDDEKKCLTHSVCDMCNDQIYVGERWRCLTCEDYDLCVKCYNFAGHQHEMMTK